MDISVIIPVFNEEKNLLILHRQISAVLHDLHREYEAIYVDDGSTDNSFTVLKGIQLKDNNVRIIGLKRRCGQTAAFDVGLRNASGNNILTIESDLTYDCNDLAKVVRELEDNDVVISYRSNRLEADGFIRFITSKIANYVRNKVLQENFKDTGCFLRGFNKKCLERLVLYREFQCFIVSFLNMQGYRIKELEIKVYPRRYGKSKYGILNRLFKLLFALCVVKCMKDNVLKYSLR